MNATEDSGLTSRNWLFYESFNSEYYITSNSLLQKLLGLISGNYEVHSLKIKKVNVVRQQGKNDCGLFCLAYIESLCKYLEPGILTYDQSYMRRSYNNFVTSGFRCLSFLTNFDSEMMAQKYLILEKRTSTEYEISF